MRRLLGVLAALVVLAGCSSSGGEDEQADPAPSPALTSASATTVEFNQELSDELIAMFRRDQGLPTSGSADETSDDRIARLKEIIEEYGWPGYALVGKKGEDAAWVIAQHADLDPEFQQQALDLLRVAVEQGDASPGNLAYLTDRVAVSNGEPQTYGTQIGCTKSGPKPSTPIKDAQDVDERRAEAGLDPLQDYLDEMTRICG